MSQGPEQLCRHVRESIHVAIAGPVLTAPLAESLDGNADGLPVGLGGTPVWQLVQDLVGRGRRISVVTLDPSVTNTVTASGALLDLTYGPYRLSHRMRDLMRVERRAVRDGVERARPDLVHAHWCYEYALGALASGIPTLVTVRDWIPTVLRLTRSRYWPYWCGRALLYFTALARASYLTANSPYIARKVRPLARGVLEVVPNGMPDNDFVAPGTEDSWETRQGEARPLIVSVNNGFGPLKNVGSLLEAFSALKGRGVDCDLHLIGDGYGPDGPCEAWARSRRISGGISYLGPMSRDAVLDRMRKATVLVHPAREESFGMALVEAMSQRTPVVGGARSGAVPWVLGAGDGGLLVDVADPRAIAEAIEAVVTQPTLRNKLSADGYEHAWRNFRQSRVTDLYLDVYQRMRAEVASK